MKKSLVALAVLAASGAAMAQSSVTLYGWADVWFGQTKAENNFNGGGAGKSLTQTVLTSGGVNGNRWGVKGSEDLGGGLKANFDFQQGFSIDSGAGSSTSATAFSRQSWVGLSGNFGALRLGRTTTPYDDVSGAADAVFDSALSGVATVFRSTGYTARPNNAIYYQAPTVAGFSGALEYALGEDKTATLSASSTTSLNLTYAAGPLALHLAYQVEDTNAANTNDRKFTRVGGSYNFGVATLKANYGKAENYKYDQTVTSASAASTVNGASTTEYQIGVDVPVSKVLTLSANVASSKDNATLGDQKRTGYGLGAAYTLSTRTYIYGGYRTDKETVLNAADMKNSVFAVGINHKF